MKRWLMLATLVLLVGCNVQTKEHTYKYDLPPELEHCKVYRIGGDTSSSMRVLYCGNKPDGVKTVCYTSGKTTKCDGIVYEQQSN